MTRATNSQCFCRHRMRSGWHINTGLARSRTCSPQPLEVFQPSPTCNAHQLWLRDRIRSANNGLHGRCSSADSLSIQTASLPSSRTVKTLAAAAGSLASATTIPEYRWPQTPGHNRMVPLYMRAPSPPSSTVTALSVSKGLLKATSDCSDMFPPLKTALTGLLVVWDLFDVRSIWTHWLRWWTNRTNIFWQQCTSDVQADFMELASKLEPVGTIAANYQELGGHNLQERLTAISMYVCLTVMCSSQS